METKIELEKIINKCNEKKYDCSNDKEEVRVYSRSKGDYLTLRNLGFWEEYQCINCKYKGETK